MILLIELLTRKLIDYELFGPSHVAERRGAN